MRIKPRTWKDWPYYIWNYRKIRMVESLVNETMKQSKSEIEKVISDGLIFGESAYEITADGVKHVPIGKLYK